MGGTSTDVALAEGEARAGNQTEVAGLPVGVPMLDIHTVGAGGGSLARFDIAGHYELGRGVLLYARAQNLFDKQYQDALGYPALGRDARVGVRYTFKGRD